MKNLGSKVNYIRRVQDITSQELSAKAKLSQPYISQIENGERTPSAKAIHKLAMALGVTSAFLMDDDIVTFEEFKAKENLKGIIDEKKYLPYFVTVDRAIELDITPDELMDAVNFISRHKYPSHSNTIR